MKERLLLDETSMSRTLKRIAHEILERNGTTDNLVLVGIKTRGEHLAMRLASKIYEIEQAKVPVEALDITFYRDDVAHSVREPQVGEIHRTTEWTNRRLVIVDDVLYTGRTVRAAMDAILKQSRPSHIQLAIVVDRGHRELPIRADFVGKNIPTSTSERVAVQLKEVDGVDAVIITEAKSHV